MPTSQPPIPPQIAAQQKGALQAHAGSMQGSQDEMQQQAPSVPMAQALMKDIGQKIQKLGQLCVSEWPELMPILKRTIQGFSMLEQELQKKAPQPGQQQPNAAPAGGDGQDGREDPESPGTVGMAA